MADKEPAVVNLGVSPAHWKAPGAGPLSVYAYLIRDARFEKVRIDGSFRRSPVHVVVGISEGGDCSVFGASCALGEAVMAHFGRVAHQRCQFHLVQDAMDHVPKAALRPLVLEHLRSLLSAPGKASHLSLLQRMAELYYTSTPDLTEWLKINIPEGLSGFYLPKSYRMEMRKTIEGMNQGLERRTRAIRIFPDVQSLLRLITARLCEVSDSRETRKTYLNMHFIAQSCF
jgi:putative transposase